MRYLAVGFCVIAGVVAGCGKAGPQAGKALLGVEKAAVKAAPAVKPAPSLSARVRKWTKRAESVMDAYDRYQELTSTQAEKPPERFPYPASSVVPTSRQPIIIDPATGAYALPNNYYGYSFYDGQGGPLGFSAWNIRLQEERYFDPFGNGF